MKSPRSPLSVSEIRKICQPNPGYVPETLFRKVSIYLSLFFLSLKVSPTTITFSRFIIGLIGIGLIAHGQYAYILWGVLIFEFALLLDYVDGEMFRYQTWKNNGKKATVLEGSFLDKVFDQIYRPLLLIAAGMGVSNTLGNGTFIYLYLGAFGAALILIDQLIKLKTLEVLVYKQQLKYLKAHKQDIANKSSGKFDWFYELFRINNPLTLYFWFAVFGYLNYFLIIYTPLLILLVLKTFRNQYRAIKELDKKILRELY